jgi:hypothetical protein
MRDAVYKEALEVVREAQEVLADAGDLRTRLPALELLLLRLEASVLECSGDAVAALARLARATRLGDAAGVSPGVGDVLQQVRLLHRVLSPEYRELTKGPMQQAVQREAARLAAGLVAAGPWRHVQQLPRVFVPGLAARPYVLAVVVRGSCACAWGGVGRHPAPCACWRRCCPLYSHAPSTPVTANGPHATRHTPHATRHTPHHTNTHTHTRTRTPQAAHS